MMNVVYEKCAGLDFHKRTVVVCASILDSSGHRHKERRTFSTMTPDLLRLRQWLKDLGVTHAAMESTASYWKPIFNILEGHMEVFVVNAQHLKAVAFPKDRPQRRRMDRRFAATWPAASQFCASRSATRGARTDTLSYESESKNALA